MLKSRARHKNKPVDSLIDNFLFGAVIVFFLFSLTTPGDTSGRITGYSGKAYSVDKEGKYLSSESNDDAFKPKITVSSNELLIKFKKDSRNKVKEGNPKDTGISSINELNNKLGVKKFEKIAKESKNSKKDAEIFGWYEVTLDSDSIAKTQYYVDTLLDDPNIEAVEPNHLVSVLATPNDPYYASTGSWGQSYPDLWGIKKINPEPAWGQTIGSYLIIVADIDTGVDRNHEDLKENMWTNPGEILNGVDDDGNGYIDDIYGWDWVNRDNDPMDDNGHGTHTAGTIAAIGNNSIGVVGVNWQGSIMALKFLNSGGNGYISDGITAIQYSADMGARVSSNSWGCHCQSKALEDAIAYAYNKGMVVVAAAGNSNADALDFSPASADYAITVAASDPNDFKADFSNWGEKLDVTAPGVDILSLRASTSPMCTAERTIGNYCRVSGTSMATPHVSGLAALLLAKNPTLSNEEIRQIIRKGSMDLGITGKDSNFGFGRIDINNAMSIGSKPLAPVIISPRSRTLVNGTLLQVIGSVTGPNFASYRVDIGAGRSPISWAIVAESANQVINGVLATINMSQFAEGAYTIRLTATDTSSNEYQFQVFDIIVDYFDIYLLPIEFISKGNIQIWGTVQTKNGAVLENYKLEWSSASSPTWSASNINLANNGLQPVTNNLLGTWDTTTLLDEQTYLLRLSVTASNGLTAAEQISLIVDKDLASGWPKPLPARGDGYDYMVPAIADLDGDKSKEIVAFETSSGKIHVFRKDGSNLPGFPVSLNMGNFAPHWSLNVDDLDADGKKEIIVASGSNNIYIIRSDGTFYPGWPKPVFSMGSSQLSKDRTPIVADLNGDSVKELVTMEITGGGADTIGNMHALRLDGSELPGFPKLISMVNPPSYRDNYGSLSAADLDRDGKPEIAFGYNRNFYLFDNNGNILPGWPFLAPLSTAEEGAEGYDLVFESPGSFGDIYGDNNSEVFAIAHIKCFGCKSRLYGWYKNGTTMDGWPKLAGSINWMDSRLHSPALADIENDSKEEVTIAAYGLYSYTATGLSFMENSTSPAMAAPSVSDVNGDGLMDFSSVNYKHIGIVNKNGQYYWQRGFSDEKHWFTSPGVFGDLDNNSKIEFSVLKGPSFMVGKVSTLYLWEIPSGANPAKYEWPLFNHDPSRTGRLLLKEIATNVSVNVSDKDTIAPEVSITNPLDNSIVSGIVSIEAYAADNIGLNNVEFYVDNVFLANDSSAPYSVNWDTRNLVHNSMHTIFARAYDVNGNAASSLLISVKAVDITSPQVAITNPLNNSIVPRGLTINISATASDVSGITKVQFFVEGSLKCTDTAVPYMCSWKVPSKPGTTYTLQAKAFDVAGNTASQNVKVKSG